MRHLKFALLIACAVALILIGGYAVHFTPLFVLPGIEQLPESGS